jgi:putative ABC transport system substrate-binding protein
MGQRLIVVKASAEPDIGAGFAMLAQQRAGALIVVADELFHGERAQLATLAARYMIPGIHAYRDFAIAGGLMSYGSNRIDGYRQIGIYVGRILKGEKPADLPVIQSAKFELVVNLKTARAMGIDMPTSILLRADEVIE